MIVRSGAGLWLARAFLAAALAASLGGVYLGLPWPRLALQAAVLLAGLTCLGLGWRRQPAAWLRGPVWAAAWLLLVVLLVSSLASTEIAVSLDATLQAVVYLVVLVFAASVAAGEQTDRLSTSPILLVLMALGLTVFLIAVVFSWSGGPDLHGLFGNKNHLAGYLLLLLPLALTALLYSAGRKETVAFGLAAALMVCGLLLSQSRGAWIALAPGLALVVWLRPRGRSAWRRLAGAGLLAAAMALLLNRAALQTTAWAGAAAVRDVASAASGQSPEGTLGPRLDYWQAALAIGQDYPWLGTGPGTFASVLPAYQRNPVYYSKYAHQVLLQALAESGLPGLTALIGLLASFWWSVARGLRALLAKPGAPRCVLAVGLAGGLVSSLAHNLVELDWYVPAIAVAAAVEGGLLLALTARGSGDTLGRAAARGLWSAAGRWAALTVCLAGLTWTGIRAAERWQMDLGGEALARGDAAAAAAAFRGAAAADPLSAEPAKALAALSLSAGEGIGSMSPMVPGEGLDSARRAVTLASHDVDAWTLLWRGYQARGAAGDDGLALAALAAAAALRHPSQAPDLYVELIQVYLGAGRWQDAADLCRDLAADYGPVAAGSVEAGYVARAHVWLGNLAASRGDAAEALAEYTAAAGLDAANASAWFNLGLVLLESGRPGAAREALEKAVALDPGQAVSHYYLGLAYEALGDRGAALNEAAAALALEGGCQPCRDLLNRVAGGLGP